MRTVLVVLLVGLIGSIGYANELSWATDQVALGYFADLLEQAGFGYLYRETAAFLLLEKDGHYRCVAWPFYGPVYQQQYTGRIPNSALAVVHTHPLDRKEPSHIDQLTAKRLGMPVIVLTVRSIYAATSEGAVVQIVANQPWHQRRISPESRCKPRR